MKYLLLSTLFVLGLTLAGCAQKLKADDVIGDWTGESKCQGSNTFCHDEIVLYHFSRIKGEDIKVHLAADKMVAGKWELMGENDLMIDAAKSTLTAEFPIPRTGGKGVVVFTVAGDKIDGIMTTYPENEIGRKIHVERKKS